MSNTSAKLLEASTKSFVVRRDSSSSATSTTSYSASSTSRSFSYSTKLFPFGFLERAAPKSPLLLCLFRKKIKDL
ncbi:hypothetical protein GOP47_0012829 [Adiantum capillus-veneris]|uniref:Uncharacterized protein n=1 Tax=Adiantum capillus-veneris TaxID=13818 RepID=A0A9D4UST5_ADICA|nr:hypothetical protein GOP47_0012829 [Adiantum capillus-veneris]